MDPTRLRDPDPLSCISDYKAQGRNIIIIFVFVFVFLVFGLFVCFFFYKEKFPGFPNPDPLLGRINNLCFNLKKSNYLLGYQAG